VEQEHRRTRHSRPGGWGNRDFHDEVPRRRRLVEGTGLAVTVTVLTFIVMVLAVDHEARDCGLNCHDGDGILAHEPGHPWTGYQESWQWQAQWLLGVGSLAIAVAALAASTRTRWRRWAPVGLVLAVLCAAGWVAWALLEPANPV
jgi:hypothetical protein